MVHINFTVAFGNQWQTQEHIRRYKIKVIIASKRVLYFILQSNDGIIMEIHFIGAGIVIAVTLLFIGQAKTKTKMESRILRLLFSDENGRNKTDETHFKGFK